VGLHKKKKKESWGSLIPKQVEQFRKFGQSIVMEDCVLWGKIKQGGVSHCGLVNYLKTQKKNCENSNIIFHHAKIL